MKLSFQGRGMHYRFVEWLRSDWGMVGIKLEAREGSPRQEITSIPPTEYFDLFASTEGGTNPWSNAWNYVAPTARDGQGPAIGQYYATRGREGMSPSGPDDRYIDAHGTAAPGSTYPADISGNMLRLQELIDKGRVFSIFRPSGSSSAKSYSGSTRTKSTRSEAWHTRVCSAHWP